MFEDETQSELTVKSNAVPEAPNYYNNGGGSIASPPPEEANIPKPIYVPRVTAKTPPPPPTLIRATAVRQRTHKRRSHRRRSGGEWAWVIIAVTLFSVVIVLGFAGVLLLQTARTEPDVLPTATTDSALLVTPVDFRNNENQNVSSGELITLDDGYTFILEQWQGGRFTILAMGLDRRPGDTGLAHRTDTMMVISIDPETQSIGILSIPRDLYVQVPGWAARQRVNSAMALGEGWRIGNGPQLAMQTVQGNLGIRIHGYLIVDFNAVIGIVDAIGGITVITEETINDQYYPDMNYGYDPFYLPAGTHQLDGYNALRFARTRHGDSDVDRAGRQQQVIYAIRDKVLDFNMLPQLIIRAPSLMSTYKENVYTDLSLEEMIELAWLIKDIPEENISTGVIDYRYVRNYENEQGQQVLIPYQAALGNLMLEVFGTNYSQ